MYKKCKYCSYVSEFMTKVSLDCKMCGKTDEKNFVDFPIQGAQKFLNQVEANIHDLNDIDVQFDLNYFEGFETTSLFLCATYEVLLENLILDILRSLGTPIVVSELLINSNQGQDRMGKVLANLTGTGKSAKAVFESINELNLFEKLHSIITTRNKYIHGNPDAFKHSDIKDTDLKYVSDNIINVFKEMNNNFVCKT